MCCRAPHQVWGPGQHDAGQERSRRTAPARAARSRTDCARTRYEDDACRSDGEQVTRRHKVPYRPLIFPAPAGKIYLLTFG